MRLARFSHPRSAHRRRLIALAVVAMVLPGFFLSGLAWRLLRNFEQLERQGWEEYGQYLADVSTRFAETRLWEDEQRLMVSIRVDPPRSRQLMMERLTVIETENPFYRFACLIEPGGNVVHPEVESRGEPLPGFVNQAVTAALRIMGDEMEGPTPFYHLASKTGDPPYQATFFSVRSPTQEMLGCVVLIWNLDHLRQTYLPGHFAAGPPNAPEFFRGSHFGAHLGLSIIDETGTPFFSVGPHDTHTMTAASAFEDVLEFWRLRISLDNRQFEQWMQSVRFTYLGLIFGMMGFIVVTAFFLVRWLTREIEYAELQSSFVSNVSHELKTPLSLISLYAETLELDRVSDPHRRRQFLQTITKESKRLAHLINNVLDVSRIEAGHKQYRLVESDIGAIVRDTLESYRFQMNELGVQLEAELTDRPLMAKVDSQALTQALINLLDNAVKYSNDSKQIQVALRRQGDHACISVRDHGIGISKQEQARIFDTFYRIDEGRIKAASGFGLGLSLVRHIVREHKGEVSVKSKIHEGSTFTIKLPLADASARDL